jgi:hypothetical protein
VKAFAAYRPIAPTVEPNALLRPNGIPGDAYIALPTVAEDEDIVKLQSELKSAGAQDAESLLTDPDPTANRKLKSWPALYV